ncbi:MAG: Coenzyme F420 hydrogenase/dehydrogenase, beta subunit C-terminal domain [Candidatus Bathyarchaeia archaeon]|jgi:coenzyme F420 hydrogenase subunit beta
MSKPKEYSLMTKEKLMTYTFIALLIITIISAIIWSGEKTPSGWNLGLTLGINAIIAVGIAVGLDALLYKVAVDSPLNLMSAAVFGLIVTNSYSLGVPSMATVELFPLEAPLCFAFVAIITIIGLVIFKKLAGLAGRKYVNPAAAAKLVVMIPFIGTLLIAIDHLKSSLLQVPSLAGPIGLTSAINGNGGKGYPGFGTYIISCFANSNLKGKAIPTASTNNLLQAMLLDKFHGWPGGACALAVIVVGIAFFIVARKYVKWRITASYLVAVAILSLILSFAYGDSGVTVRLLFELFIGSSIFLAFFMATDPATTPLTYTGQVIFGVGLAIITVLMQTYMQFFGASFVALVIMNLTTPILDKVGKLKPTEGGKEPKLPKGKVFEKVKTTACIRCGACMRICCNRLSPILIKQARDKQNMKELMKLDADFCAGCGSCNYVCPARIDLKSNILNYPLNEDDEQVIEQTFLKGTSDENLGVYTDIFSAKSTYSGQDGGVATALLVSGMQKGLFDAAIVVRKSKGYLAEAFVAESVEDIIKSSGTKYLRVRIMSKLGELIEKGKRKIAIIGTPCDIRAARRIQQVMLSECPDLELTVIGLFCFEDFDYRQLKSEVQRLLNVDLDKAEKTQIRKGKFIVTIEGKESSVPVKELSAAVEKGCLSCPDFAAKYADISIGSVGSEDGRSTVIVRSDVGAKLLENLDLAKGEVKKDEIAKLAILKKKRAEENA